MKNKLLTALSVLLCLALLVGAVCIGAVRGWQGEREKALTALSSGGGLRATLEERSMDAANLIVVVSRHLEPDDGQLARLKELRVMLSSQAADVGAVVQADAELTELAAALGQTLPQLESVQASARDQAYISSFTRTLTEPSALGESYADMARSFNNRLINAPTGWIARIFGVGLIEVE